MNPTARDPDYYDLAREDYESTRVAIRQVPPVISPAALRPERFLKYELMKAEYLIWASRFQTLSRRARHLEYQTFVDGVRDETCRAVLVSGDLALQGVAPMDLTTRILASRYAPGCGAAELVDFGHMNSYYPGFVDQIGKKDAAPALDELQDGAYDYGALCRSGGLRTADDKSWWNTTAGHRPLDASHVVGAVEAAVCFIHAPQLARRSDRLSHHEPQPVAAIVDIMSALNAVGRELQEIVEQTKEDIRRRRGRLVYDFSRMYDKPSLTDAESEVLVLYERICGEAEGERIAK